MGNVIVVMLYGAEYDNSNVREFWGVFENREAFEREARALGYEAGEGRDEGCFLEDGGRYKLVGTSVPFGEGSPNW